MQQAEWIGFEEAYRQYENPQPKVAVTTVRRQREDSGISVKERKSILVFVIICLMIGVLVIVSAVCSATLKYQINELTIANEEIEDNIAAVDIKLQTANSLTSLERKAKKELGMVYPVSNQIVYVDDISIPKDLASIVSEKANN